MSGSVKEVIRPVARNVRRLREQKGLSLSALAALAEISKSTLFKLERGEGNPSVDTLWSLARVLAVPFAALFVEDDAPPVSVLRYDEAPIVVRKGGRLVRQTAQEALVIRYMLSRHARGELESYWVDLEAEARHEAQPHPAGVVEHVFVASGTVEVGTEGETTRLEPGDRITFAADRLHVYRAVGGPARWLTVLDYPA